MTRLLVIAAIICGTASCSAGDTPEEPAAKLKADLLAANAGVEANPDDVGALAERGDAKFFLGRYDEAIADYDRMLELRPDLGPKHWQRGLALYFAGRYDESAKQFERYYEGATGDKSDRENGIWRFYAQVKQDGVENARKQLLEYRLPDRDPLPIIYRMCAGEISAFDVLKSVEAAQVPDAEKAKRRFYANLYVGLDAAIVRRDPKSARERLQMAIGNPWPRKAGYGGNFMWHVARLSLADVSNDAKSE
ncbi:MAG: tetratricopeptide repeat protein [Planctomycetaceae bacterium]|nr:tetratricopeptide repeat protein [Planctomycetaceae bacterium]